MGTEARSSELTIAKSSHADPRGLTGAFVPV
jgi:hypothetical protein